MIGVLMMSPIPRLFIIDLELKPNLEQIFEEIEVAVRSYFLSKKGDD